MKPGVLAGAAVVVSMAGAGQAFAGVSGYAGGSYLNTNVDIGGLEGEDSGWGLEGMAAYSGMGLGLQVGAAYADSDAGDGAFAADGHVNFSPPFGRIGAFVAGGDASDATYWAVGGEGEVYVGPVTLAAAFGYASLEDDVTSWAVDGEVRFFATENLRIQGEAGYANIDADIAEDTAITLGASAEYKFGFMPVSIIVGYAHAELDETDLTTDSFSIGGRLSFGGSLKDRDRNGGGLPGLSSFTSSLI
ncbi:MAG: hypothetical protein JNJ73_14130 [Hyphomonadaceae bacterium]|nr:hypothetical protein [Hyphomonadaceae bacterium]